MLVSGTGTIYFTHNAYCNQNCKDYVRGMNMDLIIANYVWTPRNPIFLGIKPPRDIRPPAISNSIDIVAVNNAQRLKGNKNDTARQIMKSYEVKAQNFRTPKVSGVQDLYSKIYIYKITILINILIIIFTKIVIILIMLMFLHNEVM